MKVYSEQQVQFVSDGVGQNRKAQGPSTLDEISQGSPEQTRRHELSQPPQYFSASG